MSAQDEEPTAGEIQAMEIAEGLRKEGTIDQRLREAEEAPFFSAAFDPDEAEELGFFIETALTPEEAEDAMLDNNNVAE